MKFSSVSEWRQAFRFKNISVKHQSQRAPVFWLKWSASQCCPQKSECLNFQSSKTGLEKQNFNCDMMKYWVCFDDELALISHTSSELAEILMRWDFFFSFTFCWSVVFLVFSKEIHCLKKVFQSLVSWHKLTPLFAYIIRSGETGIIASPFSTCLVDIIENTNWPK